MNSPKCHSKSDDGECVANYLNDIILRRNGRFLLHLQHIYLSIYLITEFIFSLFSEFHELNIPSFNPYKLQNPRSLYTLNPKLPINYVCRHMDVSIYGLEDMKVNQIKYADYIIYNYSILKPIRCIISITINVNYSVFQQRI